MAPRRRRDGFRDRAHAAAHESPQARGDPPRRPCSDAAGCRPCPGERGPPLAPITPSVASVTLTSGDSNHSSRKSAALWVKILTSATRSLFAEFRAPAPRRAGNPGNRRAAREEIAAGWSAAGPRPHATDAPVDLRIRDRRRRHARENLAISSSVRRRSCHMKKWRPSGNAEKNAGSLASTR